ncbi:hypothetical protein Lal_00010688 [Lupinus albus]|nr:hypothetical protein Lal_00010688 [Lupinus albus]
MSRIGKKPVPVPAGVTANVDGQKVTAKGPKGELFFVANDDIQLKLEDNGVSVTPANGTKEARSKWGMSRTMIENIFKGVKDGYERKLEINGVGYRAALQGKNLQLALGFSHDVVYEPPVGITIAVPKPTEIIVSGINKQQVGQVAAEIREYRGPEPYKGKGVKKEALARRASRVRRQIKAVANGRPRLSVHRSSKNIYAQIIDDVAGKTLASASTLEADLRGSLKTGADVAAASVVGKLVAERGVKAGVKDVVFDRGAFIYHGRVKALADAAREGGLNF